MGIFEKIFGKKVKAINNYKLVDPELLKEVLNVSIAYNKYGAYCIPLSSQHRTLCQKILKGNIYEPDTLEFMIENAGEGDIIHAGTCFGDFLPALSRAMGKENRIWAFEPNSENHRCAQITMVLNCISNVHLINAALGERKSEVEIQIQDSKGRGLGGSSTIVNSDDSSKVTETIRVVAIDQVIPANRNISILQLDVEGHEEQALKGALASIKRCRPILILEDDHGLTKSKWFNDNILSMDYKIKGKLHYNTIIYPK